MLFHWESSSLYTCNTILYSVHYMIHYSAISNLCCCGLSIYQSALYHLHRYMLHNDLIQILVGMFSFKLEYISHVSISTPFTYDGLCRHIVKQMIGCENSHSISEYKNAKILAVSRSGIDPNMSTFHWELRCHACA